ncbi:MAG: alpha/beta fold hydrolase [Gordonia paraffinivorans]
MISRRVRAVVLPALVAVVAGVLVPGASARATPTWGPCPAVHGASQDTLCTTIRVPQDYARPSAGTVDVLVSKLPARGERRGVLIGNPGGPGDDAIGMFSLLQTPAALRDSYDLVAVQPRGLIGSGALDCTPPSPDDPATYLFAAGALRASCEKRTSSAYIRSITTANTARDIDSARRQLGLGGRVDLLGISYGTALMSTYATLFPQHTRPSGPGLRGRPPAGVERAADRADPGVPGAHHRPVHLDRRPRRDLPTRRHTPRGVPRLGREGDRRSRCPAVGDPRRRRGSVTCRRVCGRSPRPTSGART